MLEGNLSHKSNFFARRIIAFLSFRKLENTSALHLQSTVESEIKKKAQNYRKYNTIQTAKKDIIV